LDIAPAAIELKHHIGAVPELAIVLGSGYQTLLSELPILASTDSSKLSGYPSPRVPGHSSTILVADFDGHPVLLLCGRPHYYEGRTMQEVIFPIELLAACGIKALVLTNASGAINQQLKQGDFMLISDHINLMGINPLRPQTGGETPRFLDLSQVYDPKLSAFFLQAASDLQMTLHQGVYLAVSGPTYETPAEIRAFRLLGADAVGMSTVPEAIAAHFHRIAVAGLCCITNPAAGSALTPISHEEVLATGQRNARVALDLLRAFAKNYFRSVKNELRISF
jgi:purine-nucleoside phosphorylase